MKAFALLLAALTTSLAPAGLQPAPTRTIAITGITLIDGTGARNGAEAVGRSGDLGTIEKGKVADLALLDANPLADITNTQKIAAVVANGRLFRREELDKLLAQVAKDAPGR
jgi:cytosine/adenosine deaminase-related metal-dependent hydrolase